MTTIFIPSLNIKINGENVPLIDGIQLFNKILALGGINKDLHDQNNWFHKGTQIKVVVNKLDPKRLFGQMYRVIHENPINKEIIDYLEVDGGYTVDHRGGFLVCIKHAEAIVKEWLPDTKEPVFLFSKPTVHEFDGSGLLVELKKPKKVNKTKNLLSNLSINKSAIEAAKTGFSDNHEVPAEGLITPVGVDLPETKKEPPKSNKELIRDQITEDFVDRITYIINAYYAVNWSIGGKRTVNQRIEAFIKSYVCIDKKEQEFVRWVLKEYYKHMKDNEYYGKTGN